MLQSLAARLQIAHPIILAPMAGGPTTAELVSAVSEAGALGFIGAAYLSAAQIAELGRAVRARTERPFGINLFAPVEAASRPSDIRPALEALAGYHAELSLAPPVLPERAIQDFDDQLAAALDCGATAFSFTFGVLTPSVIAAIKERDMILLGTATTVDEAIALEQAGVDGIVAQGSEAGAHRGTFGDASFAAAMIGTIALVPQVVDAVAIPVVASGGIMDGRGIAAALALGAHAVQMGTAFLPTDEAGGSVSYKGAILAARETDTRVTCAFSGRAARGIVNRFMNEVEARGASANLGYPLQNALTRALRTEAAQRDRAEFLSLWSGQGVRLARRGSAAALVSRLVQELDATLDSLAARRRGNALS